MPANFPDSPSVNDTFSIGTRNYYYDGAQWVLANTSTAAGAAFNKANSANQLANGAFLQANVANTLTVGNTLSNGFFIVRSTQRSRLNFIPASSNLRIEITDDSAGDRINVNIETFGSGGGGGITEVVQDTSPELGGDLDLNTFDILDPDHNANVTANVINADWGLIIGRINVMPALVAAGAQSNIAMLTVSSAYDRVNVVSGVANVANDRANLAQMASNAAFAVANAALPNTSGVTFEGELKVKTMLYGNVTGNVVNILSLGVGSNTGYLRVNTGNVHFFTTPAIEVWQLWSNSAPLGGAYNAAVINVKTATDGGNFLRILDDGLTVFNVSQESGGRYTVDSVGNVTANILVGSFAGIIGQKNVLPYMIAAFDLANTHNGAILAANTIAIAAFDVANAHNGAMAQMNTAIFGAANVANTYTVGNTKPDGSFTIRTSTRTKLNFINSGATLAEVYDDSTNDRANVVFHANVYLDGAPKLRASLDGNSLDIASVARYGGTQAALNVFSVAGAQGNLFSNGGTLNVTVAGAATTANGGYLRVNTGNVHFFGTPSIELWQLWSNSAPLGGYNAAVINVKTATDGGNFLRILDDGATVFNVSQESGGRYTVDSVGNVTSNILVANWGVISGGKNTLPYMIAAFDLANTHNGAIAAANAIAVAAFGVANVHNGAMSQMNTAIFGAANIANTYTVGNTKPDGSFTIRTSTRTKLNFINSGATLAEVYDDGTNDRANIVFHANVYLDGAPKLRAALDGNGQEIQSVIRYGGTAAHLNSFSVAGATSNLFANAGTLNLTVAAAATTANGGYLRVNTGNVHFFGTPSIEAWQLWSNAAPLGGYNAAVINVKSLTDGGTYFRVLDDGTTVLRVFQETGGLFGLEQTGNITANIVNADFALIVQRTNVMPMLLGAFAQSNIAMLTSSSAYDKANLANQLANGAFLQANVANTYTVGNTKPDGSFTIRTSTRSVLNFVNTGGTLVEVYDDSTNQRANVVVHANVYLDGSPKLRAALDGDSQEIRTVARYGGTHAALNTIAIAGATSNLYANAGTLNLTPAAASTTANAGYLRVNTGNVHFFTTPAIEVWQLWSNSSPLGGAYNAAVINVKTATDGGNFLRILDDGLTVFNVSQETGGRYTVDSVGNVTSNILVGSWGAIIGQKNALPYMIAAFDLANTHNGAMSQMNTAIFGAANIANTYTVGNTKPDGSFTIRTSTRTKLNFINSGATLAEVYDDSTNDRANVVFHANVYLDGAPKLRASLDGNSLDIASVARYGGTVASLNAISISGAQGNLTSNGGTLNVTVAAATTTANGGYLRVNTGNVHFFGTPSIELWQLWSNSAPLGGYNAAIINVKTTQDGGSFFRILDDGATVYRVMQETGGRYQLEVAGNVNANIVNADFGLIIQRQNVMPIILAAYAQANSASDKNVTIGNTTTGGTYTHRVGPYANINFLNDALLTWNINDDATAFRANVYAIVDRAPFAQSNIAMLTASTAYDKANLANQLANGAFLQANVANTYTIGNTKPDSSFSIRTSTRSILNFLNTGATLVEVYDDATNGRANVLLHANVYLDGAPKLRASLDGNSLDIASVVRYGGTVASLNALTVSGATSNLTANGGTLNLTVAAASTTANGGYLRVNTGNVHFFGTPSIEVWQLWSNAAPLGGYNAAVINVKTATDGGNFLRILDDGASVFNVSQESGGRYTVDTLGNLTSNIVVGAWGAILGQKNVIPYMVAAFDLANTHNGAMSQMNTAIFGAANAANIIYAGNTKPDGSFTVRTSSRHYLNFINSGATLAEVYDDSTNDRANVVFHANVYLDGAPKLRASMDGNSLDITGLGSLRATQVNANTFSVNGAQSNLWANGGSLNLTVSGAAACTNGAYLRVNTGNVHFFGTPSIETWQLWSNSAPIGAYNAAVINVKTTQDGGNFLRILDDGASVFNVSQESGGRYTVDTLGNSTANIVVAGFGAIIGQKNVIPYMIAAFDLANTHNNAILASNAIAIAAYTHANAAMIQANTSNLMAVGNTIASNGYFTVRGNQTRLNLIPGANVTINVTSDAAGDRVNVIIESYSSGGASGPPVQVSEAEPGTTTANSLWWKSDTGQLFVRYADGSSTQWVEVGAFGDGEPQEEVLTFAITAEDAASGGIGVFTYHFAKAFTLTSVMGSCSANGTSGNTHIDMNKNGTTIFTNNITIRAANSTSDTHATQPSLTASPTTFARGDKLNVDIDLVSTSTTGLKVHLIGYWTAS